LYLCEIGIPEFCYARIKIKKRDLVGGPLKKSYAGLRGVWIAGRIMCAGNLLLEDSLKALLNDLFTNISFEMA